MIGKLLGFSSDEDYNHSAHGWFRLTVIAACLTFIFIIAAGVAVIAQGDADKAQKVSQAFAPFFVGAMATVTFCAAVWRGKLGSEQIKQQKRQNDAKDEENLAKMLMDGTKLLGESKESHVLAGVAALEAVVTSPRPIFSTQAMDILVDLVEEVYKTPSKAKVKASAIKAINNGATLGRESSRILRLDYTDALEKYAYAINGLKRLHIRGAYVSYQDFKSIKDPDRVSYENCEIDDFLIEGNHGRFKGCELNGAYVKTMSQRFLTTNRFDHCDFSGAHYAGVGPIVTAGKKHPFEPLASGDNYYHSERPITGSRRVNWDDFLQRIEPIEESFDEVDTDMLEGSQAT